MSDLRKGTTSGDFSKLRYWYLGIQEASSNKMPHTLVLRVMHHGTTAISVQSIILDAISWNSRTHRLKYHFQYRDGFLISPTYSAYAISVAQLFFCKSVTRSTRDSSANARGSRPILLARLATAFMVWRN